MSVLRRLHKSVRLRCLTVFWTHLSTKTDLVQLLKNMRSINKLMVVNFHLNCCCTLSDIWNFYKAKGLFFKFAPWLNKLKIHVVSIIPKLFLKGCSEKCCNYLRWSLFIITLQGRMPATLLKRDPNTITFLLTLSSFKEYLFL